MISGVFTLSWAALALGLSVRRTMTLQWTKAPSEKQNIEEGTSCVARAGLARVYTEGEFGSWSVEKTANL